MERIVLRPHQVPAFVELIDRGHVPDEMRARYGAEMTQFFESMIAMVAADPDISIFVNLTENTVCRSGCENRNEYCNPGNTRVITREIDAAMQLFGTARIMTGFTLDQLRKAVRGRDVGSIL